MNELLKADKKALKQKLREFKKQGLLSYGTYLEIQQASSKLAQETRA